MPGSIRASAVHGEDCGGVLPPQGRGFSPPAHRTGPPTASTAPTSSVRSHRSRASLQGQGSGQNSPHPWPFPAGPASWGWVGRGVLQDGAPSLACEESSCAPLSHAGTSPCPKSTPGPGSPFRLQRNKTLIWVGFCVFFLFRLHSGPVPGVPKRAGRSVGMGIKGVGYARQAGFVLRNLKI